MPLYVGNERINNVSISFTSSDGGTNTNDATLTSGTQMLQGITAYSKGTKYTGTIPSKTSADITVTANTVKVPAGYYSTANTKTVAEATVATPAISISSDGLITASSAQTAGYVAAKTTTATTQLAAQSAKTITPSSSAQVAVDAGKYTTGNITVSAVPTETKTITANGTYSPSNGKYFSSVKVAVASDAVALQEKTITPTESTQVVNPDNGYGGFSSVTVNSIPSTYVGSGVATKGATTITPSASQQTAVSANTYVTGAITVAAVPSETKNITSNGTYTPSTGKWFSSVSVNIPDTVFNTQTKSVTPTESKQTVTPDAGYDGLSSVTVGAISSTYIGSSITRKSAVTYTPTESDQIIAAGQYLTGIQTIKGDANLVAANIASGVSIFGIAGTHSSIDTSDATATDADIVSGKTAYVNGSKVTGTLVVQNYYTGTTVPESSLGNNGDLYFKV